MLSASTQQQYKSCLGGQTDSLVLELSQFRWLNTTLKQPIADIFAIYRPTQGRAALKTISDVSDAYAIPIHQQSWSYNSELANHSFGIWLVFLLPDELFHDPLVDVRDMK